MAALIAAPSHALDVRVVDQHGKPVVSALIYDPDATPPVPASSPVDIHQPNQEFDPRFSAVPVGSLINFPN